MTPPWYVPALLTAACWGLAYTLAETTAKGVTKTSYLLVCCVIQSVIFGFVALGQNRFVNDVSSLIRSPVALIGIVLVSVAGNYLSLLAIQLKNASAAAAR